MSEVLCTFSIFEGVRKLQGFYTGLYPAPLMLLKEVLDFVTVLSLEAKLSVSETL